MAEGACPRCGNAWEECECPPAGITVAEWRSRAAGWRPYGCLHVRQGSGSVTLSFPETVRKDYRVCAGCAHACGTYPSQRRVRVNVLRAVEAAILAMRERIK